MPASKQKPIKKKRSPLFWLLVIAIPLAVIIGAVWIWDYSYDQQVNKEEDATFAKIETFVNNIKNDLNKEIPEGNWKISKICIAPGTKGDFEEYSCAYGVTSDSEISYKEKFLSIARKFSSKNLQVSESGITYGMHVDYKNVNCRAYYERGGVDTSGFKCSSRSHTLRYPEEIT